VDFGKHTITDYNAKPFDTFIIKHITVDKETGETKIKLQTEPTEGGNGPATYRGGDYVEFSEIEGLEGLNKANGGKPITIKNKRGFEFTLDTELGSDKPFDGRSLGKYKRNGKVTGFKGNYELEYKSLA